MCRSRFSVYELDEHTGCVVSVRVCVLFKWFAFGLLVSYNDATGLVPWQLQRAPAARALHRSGHRLCATSIIKPGNHAYKTRSA
jgi:hypothetical protein